MNSKQSFACGKTNNYPLQRFLPENQDSAEVTYAVYAVKNCKGFEGQLFAKRDPLTLFKLSSMEEDMGKYIGLKLKTGV
jgi:hypothetical protein